MAAPWVGIIANPVSARDIRRVIANAASLQITDRANIVLRVLACLKACGVERAVMMPDTGGIRGHVKRGLDRSRNRGENEFPEITLLDMPVTGTVEDSRRAASAMCQAGAAAIVVLGGDGTNRAVARIWPDAPLVPLSTGTNNVFPRLVEPTVAGAAAGLVASGAVRLDEVATRAKCVRIEIDGERPDFALVDAALLVNDHVGNLMPFEPAKLRALLSTRRAGALAAC